VTILGGCSAIQNFSYVFKLSFTVEVDHKVAFLMKNVQCGFADVVRYQEEWMLADQLDVDIV
jgi:hypothetical protein